MFERLGSLRLVDTSRAEFDDAVTAGDLEQLAKVPTVKTLQSSDAANDSVWPLLNDRFFSVRPDVELRVYGHYARECDLSFAGRMTNVRRFAADCLMRAGNVEAIGDMPKLEALDRFTSLKRLYLEGQSNGIEVLSKLGQLEDVTLRSITTPDLRYLAPLKHLWSLDLKLGGIRSFEGIAGKATIKYLELWQIRELPDADVLRSLGGLQNVFLQSLPNIQELPRLDECRALRRVVLENMKGLRDFAALEQGPALEEFALIEGNRQQPEQLVPVLRNPAVRRVRALFGSDRKNTTFARLRDTHGKSDWDPRTPFEYR